MACCLFWGLQQLLIKTIVGEVPPLWQATLRFVGATALLWLWCVWRRVPLFERDYFVGDYLAADEALQQRLLGLSLGAHQ